MISEKLQKVFNDQINAELYSAYLYLAMKAHFDALNLKGFANWFDAQVKEENAHAMGMYKYVFERGGKVELAAIEKPVFEAKCPVCIFEQVLKHEKLVTSKINAMVDAAEEEKDRAAVSFLNWYIKEQVEEEASVEDILSTLKFIGEDKYALLMLDKELGQRSFKEPKIG